ncbi:MAG: FGGY-family carbohydrate kinase [Actinomycetes bacterium]
MSRPLLLGVDSGQTTGKAALFDTAGRTVAVAHAATLTRHPRPRWAERDLDELWSQVAAAVRDVLAQAGPDAEVAAVGVCGHNDGAYLVDGDLRPVRPGILATDTRAHREAADVADGPDAGRVLSLTGQVPFAASPGALLTWLARHEPESLERTRWALFCKDWIRLRLTGEVATDRSEASAAFTDVHAQSWSDEALGLYGLERLREALPPILDGTDVAGHVTAEAAELTRLRAGTPVVAGAHDVDAAALGIGAAQVGAASAVLGTFSINQVLADEPVTDARWQARSFVQKGRWLHMSTSPAGAVNLDWALRRFGPADAAGAPDPAAGVAEAVAEPPREDDPYFLPFLFGSPHGPDLAGSFVGLRGWHDRGAVLRAVLEGVVLNHRTHMEPLAERLRPAGALRVCGGGARSPEWTQLLADALGTTAEVTDTEEAGARGAALLAGVGTGVYASLDDAVAASVRVVRRQEPRPEETARLEARYRRYLALVEALGAVGSGGQS